MAGCSFPCVKRWLCLELSSEESRRAMESVRWPRCATATAVRRPWNKRPSGRPPSQPNFIKSVICFCLCAAALEGRSHPHKLYQRVCRSASCLHNESIKALRTFQILEFPFFQWTHRSGDRWCGRALSLCQSQMCTACGQICSPSASWCRLSRGPSAAGVDLKQLFMLLNGPGRLWCSCKSPPMNRREENSWLPFESHCAASSSWVEL